eukprot:scaffold76635_cov63-Phaeocystis_antarctica.AAC.4
MCVRPAAAAAFMYSVANMLGSVRFAHRAFLFFSSNGSCTSLKSGGREVEEPRLRWYVAIAGAMTEPDTLRACLPAFLAPLLKTESEPLFLISNWFSSAVEPASPSSVGGSSSGGGASWCSVQKASKVEVESSTWRLSSALPPDACPGGSSIPSATLDTIMPRRSQSRSSTKRGRSTTSPSLPSPSLPPSGGACGERWQSSVRSEGVREALSRPGASVRPSERSALVTPASGR